MANCLPTRLAILGLVIAAPFLAGCAVPLGPGFYFRSRQTEIAAASTQTAHMHVRVTDQMTNTGNRDLSFLDVTLPTEPPFVARATIHVDGAAIAAAPARNEPGAPLRVRFDPQWAKQSVHTIVFDYDLDPGAAGLDAFSVSGDTFHLADAGAFPAWLLPSGLFATGDLRAHAERLDVTVPKGFRVLAEGREESGKQSEDSVTYGYRISRTDLPTFVVAGRYQEQRVRTRQGDVVFWTLAPVDQQATHTAGERLAGTVATYNAVFGPVPLGTWPIYVAETPAPLASLDESAGGLGAASFPRGVMLDRRAVAMGIASEPVLEFAEYELARTWFAWITHPLPDTQALLGSGMSHFAVVMAAEAREGEAGRRRAIAQLLADYDRGHAPNDTEPSIGALIDPAREKRGIDGYEAALFFAALEDASGKEHFERAFRRVLRDRAGKEIAIGDLRSAMEAETGRDLAGMFHTWLDRLSVPDDFRTRYAAAQ